MQLKKYLVSGIDENSEEYRELRNEFIKVGLPTNCFVQHGLKPDFVKLSIDDEIDKIHIDLTCENGSILTVPLSEEQKNAMSKAITLLRKDESADNSIKKVLMEKWDDYANLKIVKDWWNCLPVHFSITPAGVALANAYAQSKEPSIPSLY